jgi:hypothetical protein
MMPTDMPALPGTTCGRFEAEVRRSIATAVSQPVEVEAPPLMVEPEPEMRKPENVRRPWQADAA